MTHRIDPATFAHVFPFRHTFSGDVPNDLPIGAKVRCYHSCLRTGYHATASNPQGLHWSADYDHFVMPNGQWYSLVGKRLQMVCGGTITENGWNAYWGWTVRWHGDCGLYHRYAHMSQKSGLVVTRRYPKANGVGYVGSTGNASGPHLHQEDSAGNARDPRNDPATYYNKNHFASIAT